MAAGHLVAEHFFKGVFCLSRLGDVDSRFGHARSNTCREFDAMFASYDPDPIWLVLEPIYQEAEPKLWSYGFAGRGNQFERRLSSRSCRHLAHEFKTEG